jgi:hypothetical protein
MTIPPHLDAALRAIGVVPAQRHAPVYIPEPVAYDVWKPTPEQKECPF